jgi:hypothetical protein
LYRDELQAARIEKARSSSGHLEEQIRLDEEEHTETQKQLAQAQKAEKRTRAKVDELKTAHFQLRGKLQADLSAIQTRKASVTAAGTLVDEIAGKRARLKELKKLIKASTGKLADLRKEATQLLSKLADHFNQVASVLLDKEVNGKVEFHSDAVVPSLNYEGDMSSAALVTLRLLTFDLACLTGSASSFPLHPGFLLHDSPREADLSASIYRRMFTLIAEASEAPAIQYIIATTEPPPDHFQEEPWLLCPPLSSAAPDSRFLRVTL